MLKDSNTKLPVGNIFQKIITMSLIPPSNVPSATQILTTFSFAHLIHIVLGQLFVNCMYLSSFFLTLYTGRRDCIPKIFFNFPTYSTKSGKRKLAHLACSMFLHKCR